MSEGGIHIRANIRLLPTAEGGRSAPVRGSYRPNHNFGGPENREMVVGFIDLPDGVEIHPGESIELPITFWKAPAPVVGQTWRIQEGAQLVGFGTVIEVMPQ